MSRDAFAEPLGRPDLATRDEGASGISCPACQGNLWELAEGSLVQYQCRVGHVLSAESLVAQQAEAIETMLWTALNALQERAALLRRLDSRDTPRPASQTNHRLRQAEAAERQAALVQEALHEAMQAQD
jgi:two-component system, chemotaxis family, protein-glutamate methylesterase/glutaminase